MSAERRGSLKPDPRERRSLSDSLCARAALPAGSARVQPVLLEPYRRFGLPAWAAWFANAY